MQYKLISLLPLQLARLIGFVRRIEPVELDEAGRHTWVLLVRGRGFTRILRDEPLPLPEIMRPLGWDAPRPLRFSSRAIACNYGANLGLLPRRTRWDVKEMQHQQQS